jgi:hypothetical protein
MLAILRQRPSPAGCLLLSARLPLSVIFSRHYASFTQARDTRFRRHIRRFSATAVTPAIAIFYGHFSASGSRRLRFSSQLSFRQLTMITPSIRDIEAADDMPFSMMSCRR